MLRKIYQWFSTKTTRQATPNPITPDWAAEYWALNTAHNLDKQGVSYALFQTDPNYYGHWIKMYMANRALLVSRITLVSFLTHDPEQLIQALLAYREPLVISEPVRVRAPKVRAKRLRDDSFDCSKQFSVVVFRDGRFVQPMKHFHPVSKIRTCGGRP